MAIEKHTLAFTFLLAVLGMLPALSIDMNLPALTSIAKSLHTNESKATLTLALFLLGFSGAPIFSGPISDRFGRRPVLLAGSIIFTIAAFTCSLAGSIEILLSARLFQGLGAGTCGVLVMAVVRDLFSGDDARARLSHISMVRSLAPMIAPTIGVAILSVTTWPVIFLLLGLAGTMVTVSLAFGFEESIKAEIREANAKSLSVASLISNYKMILTHRISCGYAFVNALMFGCIFGYVSNSPLVFVENFHLPRSVFAALFAFISSGLMIGFFINGQLSKRKVSHRVPLAAGLCLASAASLANAFSTVSGHATIYSTVALIFLCAFSMGLISPNATHACLEPMPKNAGAASAVFASIQMITGSFASAIVANLYDGRTAVAMTMSMTCFAITSALVYLIVIRPAEIRRHIDIASCNDLAETDV